MIPELTITEVWEGTRGAVWDRLEAFPAIQAHSLDIWIARREGRVRHLAGTDERFRSLRVPWGPTSEEGWELLALAALEAAGHPCTRAGLHRPRGLE